MGAGCTRTVDPINAKYDIATVPVRTLDLGFPKFADDGWQRFPVRSDETEVYLALRPNLVALEDLTYKPFASGAINDVYKLELVVDDDKMLTVYFRKDAGVHGAPWHLKFTCPAQRQRAVEIFESYLPRPLLKADESNQSKFHRSVTVFCSTWNMGNMRMPDNLASYLPRKNYDVYAIGVQECEFVHRSAYQSPEDEWVETLAAHLGDDYLELAVISLWKLRLVVFVRRAIAPRVTNAQVDKRNEEYSQIIAELELNHTDFDVVNQFHHLFFFGDLAYRIVTDSRDVAMQLIKEGDWQTLYLNDQLHAQQMSGAAFAMFKEQAPPPFKPTAPLTRGLTGEYQPGKSPSWNDRVLYKTMEPLQCRVLEYTCVDDVMTSEHFPVYALFDVDVLQSPPKYSVENAPCAVAFAELSCKDLPPSPKSLSADPYVVFYGSFLENVWREQKTRPQLRTLNPSWTNVPAPGQVVSGPQIPTLLSFINDMEYLENEHLRVAVWDQDLEGREDAIGFAVIPLHGAGSDMFLEFSVPITSQGRAAGTLGGKLALRRITTQEWQSSSEL